jgi:hypothetical protein
MCIRLLLFREVARLLSHFGAACSMEPELRGRSNLFGYEIAAITVASTGGTV